VTDLIHQSAANIAAQNLKTLEEVRNAPALIAFSAELNAKQRALKKFLHSHLYRHYRVMRMSAKAQRIIRDLFGAFMDDGRLLPTQFQSGEIQEESGRARVVADYIAGMTDRYAIREHKRLFAVEEGSA